MRAPIVRVPSTGAVAGIQHWHCIAMISHKENQASSSSNHMQRVEARATALGKLQSQARLSLNIGVANRTAPQPPLLCVVVYHTLARRELRRTQRRRVCRQTNVASTVKAPCRAGRRVLDRSMQGGVCLRHDGGSLSSQCDALRQDCGRRAGQRGVSGIFGVAGAMMPPFERSSTAQVPCRLDSGIASTGGYPGGGMIMLLRTVADVSVSSVVAMIVKRRTCS